jgi:hypothetical protein
MLDSPLAAAMRSRVYRARRQPARDKLRPLLAAVGSVFVHLLCLLCFVLGAAYQPDHRPESKQKYMQIRLIDAPEPPPPPPPPIVLGAPPKHVGPRHQGHASQAAAATEKVAHATEKTAAAASVVTTTTPAPAEKPEPVAAPPQPVSVPQPAPVPKLEVQPIQLAGEPLTITLPTPSAQPPQPPKLQPEPERPPQAEGNRPLLPPPSLVLQDLPAQAPPALTVPPLALHMEAPRTVAAASIQPTPQPPIATPPVPATPSQPLAAQASPTINLQARWDVPRPSVPLERPQLQSSEIKLAAVAPAPEPTPPAPAIQAAAKASAPALKIHLDKQAFAPAVQPSIQAAAATIAEPPVAASPASVSKPAESPATASTPAPAAASRSDDASTKPDVSTAPEATPQGSDFAAPGAPSGKPVPAPTGEHAAATATNNAGQNRGGEKQPGIGEHGGNQAGAAEGPKQGGADGYIQLKPTGDVDIMHHGAPNIGYKSTRFDNDWTPQGESSIDTALRRAVDKTTLKHTFHLPRGVRVQCRVMPLLPMSLLGCTNPDPPAKPVAEKEYERLHMAPANLVAAPAVAASSKPAAAPMLPVDDSAECVAARISGGPPPPGCGAAKTFVPARAGPASPSSSWVPASDQFH